MGYGNGFLDLPALAPPIVSGLAANRPPASYRNVGSLYVATDTGAAYYSTGAAWIAISGGGGSGVTSVGLSLPAIFTVSGSPVTTSGTLTGTLANQTANLVFAGPASGGAAAPTFRALVPADYPVFGPSGASHSAGAVPDPGSVAGTTHFLCEDGTWKVPSGGGSGTVTSVAFAGPSGWTVSGSPITTSGTISLASPLTTKGDLLGHSTTDVRIPVGSDGQVLTADSTQAAGVKWATAAGGGITPGLVNGRLTLVSGSPVADSGVTSTLYFTPYKGDQISLYTGTTWSQQTFSERLATLTGITSGTVYDVFIWNNAGTLTLELVAWATTTARATALATQDGVYVKSGATTHLYLGTIFAATNNATSDTVTGRFVWNYYNRVRRPVYVAETVASWTYSTGAWRVANGNSSNQIGIVVGVAEESLFLGVCSEASCTVAGGAGLVGIGEDSTTTPLKTGAIGGQNNFQVGGLVIEGSAILSRVPAIGYHAYAWLEYGAAAGGTITWYGTGTTSASGGLTGTWAA